jgi:hypothetical protein
LLDFAEGLCRECRCSISPKARRTIVAEIATRYWPVPSKPAPVRVTLQARSFNTWRTVHSAELEAMAA